MCSIRREASRACSNTSSVPVAMAGFGGQGRWIDVLNQNVMVTKASEKEEVQEKVWDTSELLAELETLLALTKDERDETDLIDSALAPYAVMACKEWLVLQKHVEEVELAFRQGREDAIQYLPILLAKVSSYADDSG